MSGNTIVHLLQSGIDNTGNKNSMNFIIKHRNETRMKKSSCVMPGTQPKTMEHAVDWFKVYEKPKGVGQELNGSICLWFHGKQSKY